MALKVEIIQDKSGGNARIFFEEFQVYGFPFKDMVYALRKSEQVLRQLASFPIDIKGRKAVCDNLVSRKVYYREQPAVVSEFKGETGTVIIFAANDVRKFLTPPWSEEREEYKVTEDLLSPLIHWNRVD